MGKLKLDLDALQVESFTTGASLPRHGTVEGQASNLLGCATNWGIICLPNQPDVTRDNACILTFARDYCPGTTAVTATSPTQDTCVDTCTIFTCGLYDTKSDCADSPR